VILTRVASRASLAQRIGILRQCSVVLWSRLVHRREEGPESPRRGAQGQARRLPEATGENGCATRRARHKAHVWANGFVSSETRKVEAPDSRP